MEALPRLPMIAFDLKVSHENASFSTKLKQYIGDFYREDPESYNNEIYQLEGLRSAAVRPAMDVTGCAALKRYFCQLKALQTRFPMNKGQPAAVTFAWKDLFANIVCTLADVRFEMVCILYNIGALHCKLGADESRVTPESMKSACTHFQSAAWAFQYLREHYPQPSGIDLSPEVMKLFQDICLAQAQECILEKSMLDNRKPSIVNAIGMQALLYYRNALYALESSQIAENFQENVGSKICSNWSKYLSFKVAYMSCVVYLFQGMQSEESQKMGERVAFYQAACDKLQEARKLSKGLSGIDAINETLTYTNDIVEGKRKAAKNENEFIYHEEVPDKDLLGEPKPASLAKGIPINFADTEVAGADIFGRLIPMGAHEASSMYSEEKAKLLRKIIDAVDTKDIQLNEFMSSLQLDQLDALDHSESLPQEFIDRCALLSVKTDVLQNLVESMNNLSDIHNEVESTLSDIRDILQEEDKSEKEYQKIMGSRQPSIVSTELSREANKYLDAHNKANESNQTLQKAMNLHLTNLKVLVLPLDQIQGHVPSLNSIKDSVDHASIAEMKMLIGKVNEMQTQRKMFVSTLRDSVNADDITSQLLTRQGDSLDEIFKQEIEKHNKQVGLIEQNLFAQENILKALTDAYAKYAPTRKLISDVVRKRETFLTALMTSYDTYEDLLNKLLKGLEFYRKLSANVKKLHVRVKSTCKVQEEERSQLLATHTNKQVKSVESRYTPTPTPAVGATDPTSSAPKLKDYLPFMKNRTSLVSSDSSTSDSSYPGLYPPYVRPAPVGSEGTNENTPSTYTDPSYQVDSYTALQYPQSQTIPGQYSDQYSQYMKTDNVLHNANTNIHYHQQYDVTGKLSDYTKTTNLPSNTSQLPSNTMPYGYNANTQQPVQNQQINYSTGQNYAQSDQYTSQNYQPYNLPYGGSVQTYNTDVSDMMNNMSISSDVPATSTYLSSGQSTVVPDIGSPSSTYSTQQSMTYTTDIYNLGISANSSHLSNMYGSSEQNSKAYNASNISSSTTSPYHAYGTQQQATETSNVQSQYGNINYQNVYDSSNMSYSANNSSNLPYNVNTSVDESMNNMAINNTPYIASPNVEQMPANPQQNYNSSNNFVPKQEQPDDVKQYSYSTQTMYPDSQIYTNMQDVQNPTNYAQYTYTSVANSSSNPTDSAVPKIESDLTIQSHASTLQYQPKVNETIVNQSYGYYNQDVTNTGVTSNLYAQSTPQAEQVTSMYGQQTSMYPGYSYNSQTGAYEYIGGYQDVNSSIQQNNQNAMSMYANTQKGIYSNAGSLGTVQTPSGDSNESVPSTNSQYYSIPYGYQNMTYVSQSQNTTCTSVDNEKVSNNPSHLTYSTPYDTKTNTTISNQGNGNITSPTVAKSDDSVSKAEPSAIDLLSGLDFSISHEPLMPEIKVPPVSEHVIRKIPSQEEKINPLEKDISSDKEEASDERPLKRDIFSEPSLLNKFTQEVKSLQSFVDGFTKKTHAGITMLDSKWKKIQDTQAKENSSKSTKIAKGNLGKNASPDVLPYNDTRVVLKGFDEDDYINASHVKNISPWSIPMIISDLPIEEDYKKFWHMVFQEKVSTIVCLLTEIELQGKFYGPMTKNHKLELSNDLTVTLSDIKCNVNWTKRKLIVNYKNSSHKVTHYQISVFPARTVSAPLVLLVDKVLKNHEDNVERDPRSKTLIHCSTGAGRSSLIVLLAMVMCQVRAGHIDLKDTLDSGFLYLCGTRTNVLEDTKYLVDIYRTVLFYVQGVLCSGSVMFSGEAVSVPSGASVPPTHIPTNPNRPTTQQFAKFTKESFEEMKQSAGLKSGDIKDPLSYLDPLWSLKKRKE